MSSGQEMSDVEKAWLVSIDALLVQITANAHALVAGRMVDLWDCGGAVFQRELAERVAVWRGRHARLASMLTTRTGPCHRLIELIAESGSKPPEGPTKPQPPKPPRRAPSRPVRPSLRGYAHQGRIRDDEVAKFMGLIEDEGISVVFDPGTSITAEDVLFKPPLIVLDKVGVFYEQIAPVYERGEIERVWDPVEREPAIALAMDLALLVILREKKWTWVICDRHFKRLPWGHPCKTGPEGRPGWKVVTAALETARLIERRRGQTWRIAVGGKSVAATIHAAWSQTGRDQ